MKWLALLALGLALDLVPSGPLAAAEANAGFAARADVQVSGGESLQRLRLPLSVLQATRRAGWADLRVLDAQGGALPWAWAGAPAAAPAPAPRRRPLTPLAWPASHQGQPAARVAIEWRSDGSVLRVQGEDTARPAPVSGEPRAWLLDMKPLGDDRPAALLLDWAPQSGAGLVLPLRAEASADAQQWQPVGQAVLVELASTTDRQVLQPRMELSGLHSGQRYLRLVADAPWPLRAAMAEFDRPVPADDGLLDRQTLPVPPDGVLDLGTALPLRRMRFTLPGDAGVLPLALQRQPGEVRGAAAAGWWPVAGHTAWRLQQGGIWLESAPLALDGSTARHWRLRPAGPAPGTLPVQVELAWTAPQIVFVASGRAPYRLEAGRADAPDAALPLSALMPGYQPGAEHRLPQATLGPLQARSSAGGFWADATPAERRRWLLWAALVAAVVVLGALAWRLSREMRADATPPR